MNSKEYTLPNGKKAVFEYDMFGIGMISLECMDELMAMIADRPQGEWIMSKPEEEGFGAVFQCSRCSCEVDCVPKNYCPDCGARMKGADNE